MSDFCDILEIGHPVALSKNYNFQNLTEMIFYNLKVVEYRGISKRKSYWLCECQCENQSLLIISADKIRRKEIQSCGCTIKIPIENGEYGSLEYKAWSQAKNRCYNSNAPQYKDYGGRGIKMCDRWLNNPELFFVDMKANPTNNSVRYTLERIDVNGDYSPENCKWADYTEQANNKRTNCIIEFNNQSHTLMEWSRITGLKRETIKDRLNYGWSIEDALTKTAGQPTGKEGRKLQLNDEIHTIKEWCSITSLTKNQINSRLRLGWSVEQTLTTKLPNDKEV